MNIYLNTKKLIVKYNINNINICEWLQSERGIQFLFQIRGKQPYFVLHSIFHLIKQFPSH